MVTDEEYKALLARVDGLENKLKLLAQQYSSLYMKSDIQRIEKPEHEEHRKHKDVTKYDFKGIRYCKRQLVLECVKSYVMDNEITSFERLTDVFPDYIQGSMGVIKKVEEAEKYSNAKKRFFFSDQDVIHLDDGDYTVCSQWDAGNIKRFLDLAADLGLEITPIVRKYTN